MVTLAREEPLDVPLGFAYSAPWLSVVGGLDSSWSSIAGQALLSASQLGSILISRTYSILCEQTRPVVLRTPLLPTQDNDLCAVRKKAGDQYQLTWSDAVDIQDDVAWANFAGVPSGSPLTLTRDLPRNRRQFQSASNDAAIGCSRYGWEPFNAQLGTWWCASLTPPNMILNLSDGTTITVPSNGASATAMIAWFAPPDCTVLNFQDGWRLLVKRTGQARYVDFSPSQGFVQSDVFLGGDAIADAALQALGVTRGIINAAGNSGWIVHLTNTPSIFPGQGVRIIFISKISNTWRDLRLTGLDTDAIARIAEVSFRIVQSEFDGLWYGKTTNVLATADQILISPAGTRYLGGGIPAATLPDYHDYDLPYGMEFR